jgi:hypothetical protein
MKHWLTVLMIFLLLEQSHAWEIRHTENMMVGNTNVTIGYSDYPILAERSLDLTFNPQGGITNKTASVEFFKPNGEKWANTSPGALPTDKLPRYPRNRSIWGYDAKAFPIQGTWQMKLTINGNTSTKPMQVGPRPAGPPSNLIIVLAIMPILAMFIIALRAWIKVQPLRHTESRIW